MFPSSAVRAIVPSHVSVCPEGCCSCAFFVGFPPSFDRHTGVYVSFERATESTAMKQAMCSVVCFRFLARKSFSPSRSQRLPSLRPVWEPTMARTSKRQQERQQQKDAEAEAKSEDVQMIGEEMPQEVQSSENTASSSNKGAGGNGRKGGTSPTPQSATKQEQTPATKTRGKKAGVSPLSRYDSSLGLLTRKFTNLIQVCTRQVQWLPWSERYRIAAKGCLFPVAAIPVGVDVSFLLQYSFTQFRIHVFACIYISPRHTTTPQHTTILSNPM